MTRRLFALAGLYDHLLGVDQSPRMILEDYLASLCTMLTEFHDLERRGITLKFVRNGVASADLETATSIGLAVNELVANSVEHAFGDGGGTILVCVSRDDDGTTSIIVEDDGRGIEGREGFGMTTLRRLLAQLQATFEVGRRDPHGTVNKIKLALPFGDPAHAGSKPRGAAARRAAAARGPA